MSCAYGGGGDASPRKIITSRCKWPRKIVASNVYPPIPIRQFDWQAHYNGEEERGEYGYGATEQQAIADLTENYPEAACK